MDPAPIREVYRKIKANVIYRRLAYSRIEVDRDPKDNQSIKVDWLWQIFTIVKRGA